MLTMMDPSEQIDSLKQARAHIEQMLRNADMELHWALWNLGEPVSLRPEIDYAARAA
jgi:hypothetical protein